MAKGIEERHARSCRTRNGGRCDCEPSYRADVWDGRRRKRIRRTFTDRAEAASWRRDALVAVRRGRTPQVGSTVTVREAWAEWKRLAETGVVRTRKGAEFKPATVRTYDQHLRMRVFDVHGDEPMADLSRIDWQTLVDDLLGDGSAPATVGATMAAVAVLYRHEVSRGRLKDNPLRGLEVPTPDNNGRERFASPTEAAKLLAALPVGDRAVWGTAFYAGLRCGELQALRCCDVRLSDGVIDVQRGWDRREGPQPTKSRNRRRPPIASVLNKLLAAELLRTGRRDEDLVFGSSELHPFSPQALQYRADKAWKAAKLERLTLHDCRHTYASLMIAAGVNPKALSTYMGHSSVTITLDRYGHLFPGNEAEAAELLDSYLSRAAGT
jgi:integrase